MNITKKLLFVVVLAVGQMAFIFEPAESLELESSIAYESLFQELLGYQEAGERIVYLSKDGTSKEAVSKQDLRKLAPQLFFQNRVRVTLSGRSENDLCSTELVIMDKSGKLEGNYTVNSCSSYGWIFFTESNCFDVILFHDAGLEAPYGSSINGSVDWTFRYNDESPVSGTYMDMGAANMYKVASPCYPFQREDYLRSNHRLQKMETGRGI